jgi:putative transcriptional regulator
MIALNLHKIMGEKRLKLADLERLTGVHYSVLSKYYNDKIQRFDRDVLNKICNALKCNVNDLLEFENDNKKSTATA